MSVYQLASVITAHAWSPDRTRVAVCENEPDVIIYSNCQNPDVKQWKREHVLSRHTMVVVGIDWCAKTNKLVTCSHDVNAFVWTFNPKSNTWDHKLTILRINRAALSCKWAPDGSKFAVASGSKVVPVCYYEQNQDWWVSKIVKKHRSTVIDLAWHPCSQIIATACADFKCRVFNAFVDKVDNKGVSCVFGNTASMEFGQLITEFEAAGGWIESVAWSPSGNGLAFCGHDSTVSFVNFETGTPVCTTIRSASLPYTRLMFMSERVVIGAGYGFEPEVYQLSGPNAWSFVGSVDPGDALNAGAAAGAAATTASKMKAFVSSKKLWEKKVREGSAEGSGSDNLATLHHNVITDMVPYADGFSTAANDGRIVVWSGAFVKKNVPGITV